ncbi:MAG: porin [Pirellulales bacterium]|nr:porin [Pirellulales bacterium]
MIFPAGLMALWMAAATPAGAIFDIDAGNDATSAVFSNEVSVLSERGGGAWRAPLPPPKALPFDPAYAAASAPPPSRSKGIPGLRPLEDNSQPPPPPEKIIERRDVIDDDYGEAFCSDEGACEPGGCDLGCCPPRRGFHGWFRDVCWEGWLDQGFTLNTLSPRNRTNGPVTFNDRSNDYQLNQLYMRLLRDMEFGGSDWDVGGRVDLLYGTDQIFVSARGLEVRDDLSPRWNAQRYGLAMPQCYMEVYSPWGSGLSVKLGHFYSILNYESIAAPDNFFYSHSYAFQYAMPLTHTGLLAETKLGDFKILAGMTRGDDNWEDDNNDLGFTGGIKWASRNQRTKVSVCVDAAREQPDPDDDIRTVYSLIVEQKLGRRWECVLLHEYGNEPGAAIDRLTANWYGLNTYLFYAINDCWKAGMRFEWFRDEGGARVPGANQTGDYFELTPGVNWTPSDRLIVRSELRWDWTGTAGYHPFGDGARSNQLLLDCDVIVRF